MNKEKSKKKIQIDMDKLSGELKEEIKGKIISELVVLKDDMSGWSIELQSGSCNQEQLLNLAWHYSQNIFPRNKKIPNYVR